MPDQPDDRQGCFNFGETIEAVIEAFTSPQAARDILEKAEEEEEHPKLFEV